MPSETAEKLADFNAAATDGTDVALTPYDGQVVLVVNTASQCGYAGQMSGLQQLHDDYLDRGFAVLGFPSDQFKQEPLSDAELPAVCERTGVTFPVFGKVRVNGKDATPLYRWLRNQKRGLLGGRVNWNFTKFLVGRDGQVISRYSPTTEPEAIRADIEQALAS